mgnify:FL=1
MMFEKIVWTGICTLLQIPCESAVAFCKNPSPKAIMHGFLPATVSVAEMLQFERLLSLVFPALGTAGVESFLPDRELADSVLQVSVSANKQVVEELRGDENMCQALLEIMEPEINKIKENVKVEVTREVTRKGIKSIVTVLRDCGQEDAEIIKAIVKEYGVSAEQAADYL